MRQENITIPQVYHWLSEVSDPEIPVLSILDLGIVREVTIDSPEEVTVRITPTYTGCPAMDLISRQIKMALIGRGVRKVTTPLVLSPAWTTDWITDEGKKKMKDYGIAPPVRKSADPTGLFETEAVSCPKCGSADTRLISQFGATSCKALYSCTSCKEPFEHFKCH